MPKNKAKKILSNRPHSNSVVHRTRLHSTAKRLYLPSPTVRRFETDVSTLPLPLPRYCLPLVLPLLLLLVLPLLLPTTATATAIIHRPKDVCLATTTTVRESCRREIFSTSDSSNECKISEMITTYYTPSHHHPTNYHHQPPLHVHSYLVFHQFSKIFYLYLSLS